MNKQKQENKGGDHMLISDTQERRAIIAYSVAAVVFAILLGSLTIINLGPYLPGLFIKACQMLGFMACGLVHVSFMNRNTSFPNIKFPGDKRFTFSLFLSLVMSVALLVFYLVADSRMIGMAFASGCSFLLPFVVQQTWKTYNTLPPRHYKVWFNSDVVMDSRTTIFLNSVPVRLRLSMKYFDITEEEFELTVPGHTQFGRFFNQFIVEKNKNNPAIECVDMEKRPFGWQFYVEQFWGLKKQFIDPELSLRENNVRDHSIIIAKRQRAAESLTEAIPVAETKTLPQLNRHKSINKHEAGK